jgi:mannose/fructose/N-acetylgalactosamine-specific phosphotransferase system component IIC
MVPLTMAADSIVRKWNSRLWETAAAGAGYNAGRSLAKAHLLGLVIFYLKSFVLYLVLLPAGIAAIALFLHLPELVHRAMAFFVKLLPFLGAALVVRNLSTKIIDGFLLMGFVIAAMVGQAFPVPEVIVILTIIGGLLGARYRETEACR